MRRFPPICHSYLRDCFWDLICWKETKDFETVTDTDETDCAKSIQNFQAESGGIFTSKKENNLSNIDDRSVSREKIASAFSNNFAKMIFHFHTNITNNSSERYFGLSSIQINPLLSSIPINNSSKKATSFRLLFCVVPFFLSSLQTPNFPLQNTASLIFFLNTKYFFSTTG